MKFSITVEDNEERKQKTIRPHTHDEWVPVKEELYKFIKKELKLNNNEMEQVRINRREINLENGTVIIGGYVIGDVDRKLHKKLDKKKIKSDNTIEDGE